MKMKIINETEESTKLLRKITKAVALHEGILDNVQVRFIKAKGKHIHGMACVGKRFMIPYSDGCWRIIVKMSLTSKWKTNDLKRFVQVFMHEFGHTKGLQHRDMMKSWNLDVSGILPTIEKIIGETDEERMPILLEGDKRLQEIADKESVSADAALQKVQIESAERKLEDIEGGMR